MLKLKYRTTTIITAKNVSIFENKSWNLILRMRSFAHSEKSSIGWHRIKRFHWKEWIFFRRVSQRWLRFVFLNSSRSEKMPKDIRRWTIIGVVFIMRVNEPYSESLFECEKCMCVIGWIDKYVLMLFFVLFTLTLCTTVIIIGCSRRMHIIVHHPAIGSRILIRTRRSCEFFILKKNWFVNLLLCLMWRTLNFLFRFCFRLVFSFFVTKIGVSKIGAF